MTVRTNFMAAMVGNMKINIVNYEEGRFNGILSKFAYKMEEELKKCKDIEISVSPLPRNDVDINHHINYASYQHIPTKNTLMVTHIDTSSKIDNLKKGMETADVGVCFSDWTLNNLVEGGFDKDKLVTILPAHDNQPRRHQIVCILTNVYPDGCKREQMFAELAKTLDNNVWAFRIMGKGWHEILAPLVAEGLQVDYFHEFDKENHQRILESSDYNLYFGKDEGSMAILDAKHAGLKIIAPNVGFNIDIGVDYPFDTQEELNEVFKKLTKKVKSPVKGWTWKKFCNEHIKIWEKLLQ